MTDRYSKVAKAVSTSKTTGLYIASLFVDNLVIPYCIQTLVLTDNGTQFFSKFLKSLWASPGAKYLTTTVTHLQVNVQAKRINETIIVRLRHYVSEHQKDCSIYIQLLTFSCSGQVHQAGSLPASSLVLSRQFTAPTALDSQTGIPTDPHRKHSARTKGNTTTLC